LIYHGVFLTHPGLTLAGLTGETYLQFIGIGFLFQNVLASGFHGFSSRLIAEWSGKTLSLIWMAPSLRVISFLSLNAMEYCRLGMLFLLLLLTGLFPFPPLVGYSFFLIGWLGTLWIMGLMLGVFRAGVQVLDRGYIDILDQVYLVGVFSSCPYIPLGLLPAPIQLFCRMNPFFHFLEFGKKLALGSFFSATDVWLSSLAPLLVTFGMVLFWHTQRNPLRDKSFG
jgi:ABC-type polysaccharide/polyol phosphate export permease